MLLRVLGPKLGRVDGTRVARDVAAGRVVKEGSRFFLAAQPVGGGMMSGVFFSLTIKTFIMFSGRCGAAAVSGSASYSFIGL